MMNEIINEMANLMNEGDAKDRLLEDPQYRGFLAKQAILIEIGNGLPNGPYYVGGVEITMQNINKFTMEQLAKASLDNLNRIMSDPNGVLII